MVDDKHIREVYLGTTLAKYLRLKEACRRVRPAGTTVCLILDRGNGELLDDGKLVALAFCLGLLCDRLP